MESLQKTEVSRHMGVDFYRWVVGTLSLSRASAGYRRLHAPVRKRVRFARLRSRRTRVLKFKRPFPRLRLRLAWFSPFTLLAKLRDAYISLLQAASNKMALTEGLASFPGVPYDFGPSSRFTLGGGSLKAKEAELDKILEFYLRTYPQLLTDGA